MKQLLAKGHFISNTHLKNPISRTLKQYWPLLLAMTLGLLARILWLSAHSVLLDEATVAVGARDIIQNHTPMWEAMSNAPFVWMIAQMLGTAGLASDFLLRIPSALIGVATIAAAYGVARRLFNRRIAITSAFLLALHPFAVAFSRVLFADPFQVFFVLLGCYGFDRLATNTWRTSPRKWMLLLYLVCIWGLAFIMKYNAVVPGAIWLFSGVVARRYRISTAFAGLCAMVLGALLTLMIWPYDESVWLFAFMGKAGSYTFSYALNYYVSKIHLVFFGITEILFLGSFLVVWLLLRKYGKADLLKDEQSSTIVRSSTAMLHLTLFLLLQTAALIVLGRMFERYLLVLVPFGCILIVAILLSMKHLMKWDPNEWMIAFREGKEDKLPRAKTKHVLFFFFVWYVFFVLFPDGAIRSYSNYINYLQNDVDYTGLAHTVLSLEKPDQTGAAAPRRAFWLVPEPIAAYYLGYTQRYSRAVLPNLDGPTANQNFFEFAAVPYATEWKGDKVLVTRKIAREWGIIHILNSPKEFLALSKHVSDSAQRLHQLPVEDYLSSDFVHSGDLLIMQSGLIDLQGEPILEDVTHENGPPFIPTLPLDRFSIFRVYRPEGLAPATDTTLERIRAGAWLLLRK
jgi:4-amino-4-deoxy-L-arabinose transferase-like glycosyltransferase